MENKAENIILLRSLLKKFYAGEISQEDNALLYKNIKDCDYGKLSSELKQDISCYLMIHDLTSARCSQSLLDEIEKEIETESKPASSAKASVFKKFLFKFSSVAAIVAIICGLFSIIIFKTNIKNKEAESTSLITQYPYDIMPDYDEFLEEGYTVIDDPTIAAQYIYEVNNTLKANMYKGLAVQSTYTSISRKVFSSPSM